MVTTEQNEPNMIYQGEYGEFTITPSDRREVIIYRSGLAIAAISFVVASSLILGQGATPFILQTLTVLFYLFCLGLGISLVTIHIYLIPLQRLLQLFWLIGTVSGAIFSWYSKDYLALFVYNNPLSLLAIGFIFVALAGIYFKEAFCFNRLETKILTPVVPLLLLGHFSGLMSIEIERLLLVIWSVFFLIFVIRKAFQEIPKDIGDKSIFTYLKQQKQ